MHEFVRAMSAAVVGRQVGPGGEIREAGAEGQRPGQFPGLSAAAHGVGLQALAGEIGVQVGEPLHPGIVFVHIYRGRGF